MTQPLPDPIVAMIGFLKSHAEINATTGGAIFGQELPRSFNTAMPTHAIVVRLAGGQGGRPGGYATMALGRVRVEIRVFGPTIYESQRFNFQVERAVKFALVREAFGETLLHGAVMENGPIQLREPDVDWPFFVTDWLVSYGQEPIAQEAN